MERLFYALKIREVREMRDSLLMPSGHLSSNKRSKNYKIGYAIQWSLSWTMLQPRMKM